MNTFNDTITLYTEMKDNHLRGTYEITAEDRIDWRIQDNIRIEILLHASDVGLHDVLVIYYYDDEGKEHRAPWGDDYPHDSIMEMLLEYNDLEFTVKKGLFGPKLKYRKISKGK